MLSYFYFVTAFLPLLRSDLAVYKFITTSSPSNVTNADIYYNEDGIPERSEKPAAPQASLISFINWYPTLHIRAFIPDKI